MQARKHIARRFTALLVYGRPPLVFAGMLCAFGVMWSRQPGLYIAGLIFLFIAMSFDLIDGWFTDRYPLHPTLTNLVDRIMDKVVYSIIFPLVAVGMMWRLVFVTGDHTRAEILHAILVLLLCIAVLVRDNLAQFIRTHVLQQGVETETRELIRLRTVAAAPIGLLLYMHAFYLPEAPASPFYTFISRMANPPLRAFFLVEIVFLIIIFSSLAALFRKYGTLCLDEVCHEDDLLRRRILAFFPNALTVLNAMMGLLALFFAAQGRLREAYLFLMGAAIFDKLDGALARRLGLTTPGVAAGPDAKPGVSVGGILDDLADGVSFCLVPALIFYLTMAKAPFPEIKNLPLGLVALAYFLLGVGRLIYFTRDRTPIPGFFKGLPTPAAALLVTAPLLLFSRTDEAAVHLVAFWGWFSFGLMIVAALAMNLYPVHYLHFGRYVDRHPWVGRLNLAILLGSMFTPYFGYVALFYGVLYFLSPLITRRIEPPAIADGKG